MEWNASNFIKHTAPSISPEGEGKKEEKKQKMKNKINMVILNKRTPQRGAGGLYE
jgi:hypothetical protein